MTRLLQWPSKLIGMAMATIFTDRPQGYFIPYRYAADCKPYPEQGYPELARWMDQYSSELCQQMDQIAVYLPQLIRFQNLTPPLPRWQQDWFPGLDGASAYSLVRDLKPSRIIEVGSGHSTRFMAKAVADEKLNTRIICIDPQPRADITALKVELHNQIVQQLDLVVFSQLQAGDLLFIDSSHILMPGTDVDWLFNRIVPFLPKGVIVHIHDMLLPDAYPEEWQWRGYNEQALVAGLLASECYDLLWSSHYARSRLADQLQLRGLNQIPLEAGALETSLWLIKR